MVKYCRIYSPAECHLSAAGIVQKGAPGCYEYTTLKTERLDAGLFQDSSAAGPPDDPGRHTDLSGRLPLRSCTAPAAGGLSGDLYLDLYEPQAAAA